MTGGTVGTLKTLNVSTAITTITPTAISTPNNAAATRNETTTDTSTSAKINNILVASNALPHGTNCLLSNKLICSHFNGHLAMNTLS